MSEPIRWHRPTPEQLAELAAERRERYEARLALDWCRRMGDPHLRAPPPVKYFGGGAFSHFTSLATGRMRVGPEDEES